MLASVPVAAAATAAADIAADAEGGKVATAIDAVFTDEDDEDGFIKDSSSKIARLELAVPAEPCRVCWGGC